MEPPIGGWPSSVGYPNQGNIRQPWPLPSHSTSRHVDNRSHDRLMSQSQFRSIVVSQELLISNEYILGLQEVQEMSGDD